VNGETTLRLLGAGGEPVDLHRTLASHGVAGLPPVAIDEAAGTLRGTFRLGGHGPRMVTLRPDGAGHVRIGLEGTPPLAGELEAAAEVVRHILRLDADLSPFYRQAATDPALAWATYGAGRMSRCPTVFEEVVKTICTTNCAWSATVRMVTALVQHLGEPAPGAPADTWHGRAFPTPDALANADDDFYRSVIRCGYRGAYLRNLATSVASGELDLEAFGAATAAELPDAELETRLLALPGVGPYAAAHVMTMLGRYSRLVLDSWTRPTYARLLGRESVPDKEIVAAFAHYGDHAGLAFWLTITRDWIASPAPQTAFTS
jgi:N-glycosylase/DNA lyase